MLQILQSIKTQQKLKTGYEQQRQIMKDRLKSKIKNKNNQSNKTPPNIKYQGKP